jgi:hypothetical protein
MLVLPACAQPVSDVLNNDPVGTTFSQRLKSLVETLDAPLCTGKGPLFLQAWTRGQNHIRKLASLAEEDLLHDKEVKLRQSIAHKVSVGINQAHLFAEKVHRLELAFVDCVDHHVVVKSRLRRQ